MLIVTDRSNLHFKQEGGVFNNVLVISALEGCIRFRVWTLINGQANEKILDMKMSKKIIGEINRINNQI